MNKLRTCVTCKIEKLATSDNFYKDKNRPLGLMYRCKECDKKRVDNRTYAERKAKQTPEQRQRRLESLKRYNKSEKGRAFGTLKAYQYVDASKNLENDLTVDDIIQFRKNPCIYCGYPSTGCDRIFNNIGHIKTNCVPCCKECNIAIMDNFTHEEMFLIGEVIKKIKDLRVLNMKTNPFVK